MTPPPTQATPGDAPDTPPKAARRGPSLGRFITSVRDLVQRNPILSVLSVVVLFLVGWFAETTLDRVWSKWFPDAEQVRAQALRERIDEKTDAITRKLAAMETTLAEAGDDGVRSEAFMAAARSVMEELEKLRPEITEVADNADRFAQRLSDAKARALAATGQSALADFVLPLSGGMTLCPSRFTFAVNRSSSPGHVYMILSHRGENKGGSFRPGESTRIEGADGAVSVGYLGPAPDGEGHRFNFSCDAA